LHRFLGRFSFTGNAGQTAERAMASIVSSSNSQAAESQTRRPGLIGEIREFWYQFIVAAFHPYRPEQHYMRGPGPAWRAKHVPSSHLHST
jgi:hypothetical protein